MDVRLTPEQRALRDSVAQVVAHLGVTAVGQLDDGERRAKLDAAVHAAGWRELRAAGDGDAPLASGVEVAIVAEELAAGAADASLIGPTLAAELRRRAGAPPAPVPETVLLTADLSALAEAGDGSPAADALAVDGWGIERALVLVPDGSGCTLGLVSVPSGRAGTDLTRGVARCGPGAEVRPVPDLRRALSVEDLTAVTALGLAVTSAELVGSIRGAVDLAVAYAKDRRQYGTPIGAFQAVQHLLADAFVALEGSRSVARHAAWAVDALAPDDALAAAALAKAYCARAARTACETSIQVHGGIGNTWECLAHVHLRRALLSTDLFGGAGASLERVLSHQGIGGSDGLR